MTPEQFAYWLQGFTELSDNEQPTPEQWKMITEHLATVFMKVTPQLDKHTINQPIHQPLSPSPTFPQPWEMPTIICGPNKPLNQCVFPKQEGLQHYC